jgi:hypothetical protein
VDIYLLFLIGIPLGLLITPYFLKKRTRPAEQSSPPPPHLISKEQFIAALKIPPSFNQTFPAVKQAFSDIYDDYKKLATMKMVGTPSPDYFASVQHILVQLAKRLPSSDATDSLFSLSFIDARDPDAWHSLLAPITHIPSLLSFEVRAHAVISKYGTTKPVEFDCIDKVLGHTDFGGRFKAEDFAIRFPFHIPDERWFEGAWIVAAQGRGKTNLLRHLALNLPRDASYIFMDAKGELIDSLSHLKEYKDRLVILEPDEKHPLAINPLDIEGQSVELLEYIFSALLEARMTPNQSTLFRLTLLLCTQIPNATLETFREIMQHGWKKYEKEMRTLKKRDQDFFEFEWDSKLYKERRPEVLSRLRTLMASPSLDQILSAQKTKLYMGRLMDAGKIILINNSYDRLGEQGAEFFGRLFIALVWAAARARTRLADHHKRPVYFFIDEAHFSIARDTNVATILDQCRAQKIAMIFAHQRIDQIKDGDVKSALTNCAIKFANSTGDAPELASRLETTPEFIKAQTRGSFACYVVDTTANAVSLSVPFVDMDQYPKMTSAEFLAVQTQSHRQFCQSFDSNDRAEQDAQPRRDDTERRDRPRTPPPPSGDDTLHWIITISPKKAAKGGTHPLQINADTSGAKKTINITIPAGTRDGARFRLRGAGVFRRDGARGDIVLTLRVPSAAQHSQIAIYGDIPDPDEIG